MGLMYGGGMGGQNALGLSRADGVTVLSGNYLMSTLVPAAYGFVLLGEVPREGTGWLVPLGLATALFGAWLLIRQDPVAATPAPAELMDEISRREDEHD